MTSTSVSDITQPSSFLSDSKSNVPIHSDAGTLFKGSGANEISGGMPASVDTVSISSRSRQVAGDVTKEIPAEVAKKEKVKKEETTVRLKVESAERALSKVEFVYNQRGELIVKYLDASDRLIYQVPSELMLFQRESASKVSSVDANV